MVASSGIFTMDILAIFRMFSEVKSRDEYQEVRREVDKLSQVILSRRLTGDMILDEISRAMESLNLSNDSPVYTSFYNLVFFICRENNQKNISTTMAASAWKLLLQGRFRLLDCWCDFIRTKQQYNISEDTWQQVLPFTRSVGEDLQEHDPLGCWPVLVDDFVEHVYRIRESTASCSSNNDRRNNAEIQRQQFASSGQGLAPIPRSKRRYDPEDHEMSKRSRFFDENNF